MTGRFIVLEGGDGSGKSTQAKHLATRLRARGLEVIETFEPGGTTLGSEIRALLLDGSAVAPTTETLLMAADRAQHISEIVRPALDRGAWVVSDRHVPSSLVYQGVVRGLGVDAVERISTWATDGLLPDLVVVIDVTDDVAERRRSAGDDRIEREGVEFHARVRAAYRELAADRGWCVLDGDALAEIVATSLFALVEPLLES